MRHTIVPCGQTDVAYTLLTLDASVGASGFHHAPPNPLETLTSNDPATVFTRDDRARAISAPAFVGIRRRTRAL